MFSSSSPLVVAVATDNEMQAILGGIVKALKFDYDPTIDSVKTIFNGTFWFDLDDAKGFEHQTTFILRGQHDETYVTISLTRPPSLTMKPYSRFTSPLIVRNSESEFWHARGSIPT